jgi:ribokinase
MKILVSGLITIETTAKIDGFPIEYSPIDYKFFGNRSTISGVGYNVIKAIKKLGGEPVLFSIIGNDIYKDIIKNDLENIGINSGYVLPIIQETSQSIILYNENKRKIILDLKDIQETKYPVNKIDKIIKNIDMAVLCNIDFSRDMLKIVKSYGKIIATDVHVVNNSCYA